jgi:hypothetical protein
VTGVQTCALPICIDLVFNFAGRRFFVFPEKPSPDWKPQVHD